MIKKVLLLLSLSLLLGAVQTAQIQAAQAVPASRQASANPKAIVKAARELIGRITPGYEKQYVLEIIPADPQSGEDIFEVDSRNGKVVLRGNNVVALASAFNWYLKYTCGAQLSWFGDQLNLPERLPLPASKERRTINGKYRMYFNYCTLSYTAPWWDWQRWQREIDFMAMSGINTPLQPIGLDAVWYNTLLKMGFTDEEARSFLVTPAHQAWQWMPNIESIGGPLPKSWIDSHVVLARQIFSRQLELGMTPIQQGFTGYVPKLLAEKYPEAKIAKQPEWYGFEGVSQLDPLDPLFDRIGKLFMEEQKALFGAHGYYAADPFHESVPPTDTKEYLSAVGQKIYHLIDDFDPQGTVMMQAWSIREPIVTQFPKDRLVVLDLNGSTYPGKKNFWGYPFVAGNLHNFGGRINMHGDLSLLASNQYLTALKKAPNVAGSGLFMESILQNPAYYAMAFEMPMHRDSICPQRWLEAYSARAYGAESAAAEEAWHILLKGPYGKGTNGVENSSIIAARPAIDVKKSGPNAGFHIPYDPQQLLEAEGLLLSDSTKLKASKLYRFDVVDVQRQIMSNLGQQINKAAAAAYKAGDMVGFKKHSERFLALLLDVDALLATRTEWNFDQWVTDARRWGTTPEEKDLLERDATALVTYWGFTEGYMCQQFDYSWREWAGLIRRYYYPRWKMFYEMLERSVAAGKPYTDAGAKMNHGREAFRGNAFYDGLADWEIAFVATPKTDIDPAPKGDEVDMAGRMFRKYNELAKEYYQ